MLSPADMTLEQINQLRFIVGRAFEAAALSWERHAHEIVTCAEVADVLRKTGADFMRAREDRS